MPDPKPFDDGNSLAHELCESAADVAEGEECWAAIWVLGEVAFRAVHRARLPRFSTNTDYIIACLAAAMEEMGRE